MIHHLYIYFFLGRVMVWEEPPLTGDLVVVITIILLSIDVRLIVGCSTKGQRAPPINIWP